jgi:uncharacterized membrane protein YbhN (UPF0104 family)
LQGADPTWIGLALLAVTAATWSMARRWQLSARALGIEIGYPVALREYYLGQLVNSVLPGGVVGDVSRAVRLRHEADLNRAAQSVVAERLLGQIAMFGLVFAGFTAALAIPGGLDWPRASWAVPIGLGSCAAVGVALSRTSGTVGRFAQLTLRLQRQPEMIVHAVVTPACLILGFYACARATGTLIPASGLATLIPLILTAMLIPLSVGGWGWREGAAAALFPVIGASAGAGVAAGIAYGAVVLIAALPAGLILFRLRILKTFSTIRRSHST